MWSRFKVVTYSIGVVLHLKELKLSKTYIDTMIKKIIIFVVKTSIESLHMH
jgi:hypothetical protein